MEDRRTVKGCLLFLFAVSLTVNGAGSSCRESDKECEFWLEVEASMTMMWRRTLVIPHKGHLYRYDAKNFTQENRVPLKEVISGDGEINSRLVIVVNGSMPGPPIEVFENQTVIVHVKNKLTSGAVTIHWHGLHQPDTPWMDGVAYVTQCPIAPYQSFTYRFTAKPSGTFWYHSHIGTQRSMGVFGALIIRKKEAEDEHIMTIQDWNHDWDSELVHQKMIHNSFIGTEPYQITSSVDGGKFSNFVFQSGLINGRGRFYGVNGTHNGAPLSSFEVTSGKTYRFRVIATGTLYPFQISIDQHNLTIEASDGFEIEPRTVDSFVINPGERVDFTLTADQPGNSYWIRGETLEHGENHTAEAILHYEGEAADEPNSTRRPCSEASKCVVVNCPFSYFPQDENKICVRFDQLRSRLPDPAPAFDVENFKEYFLNFAFPGVDAFPGSVNGRSFVPPPVSALTQPGEVTTWCNDRDCGEQKVCHCTYSVDLKRGEIVQMVFLNMGVGKGFSHPIHMHGHSFYVLKMGYPIYNETTGKIIDDNPDIDCRGATNKSKSFCNSASWSNSSWENGNVPDLELNRPTRKDTIIVPTGGYVVIRFRADNPGLWFMHCHIELHNIDGMAMVINETFTAKIKAPDGFPKCGDYPSASASASEPKDDYLMVVSESRYGAKVFWAVVSILIIIVTALLVVVAWLVYKIFRLNKHTKATINIVGYDNAAVDK